MRNEARAPRGARARLAPLGWVDAQPWLQEKRSRNGQRNGFGAGRRREVALSCNRRMLCVGGGRLQQGDDVFQDTSHNSL